MESVCIISSYYKTKTMCVWEYSHIVFGINDCVIEKYFVLSYELYPSCFLDKADDALNFFRGRFLFFLWCNLQVFEHLLRALVGWCVFDGEDNVFVV